MNIKQHSRYQTELIFDKKKQRNVKRSRSKNITCFNPPFSRNFTTNIAKRFLDLLDLKFPKSYKIQRIFSRNIVASRMYRVLLKFTIKT